MIVGSVLGDPLFRVLFFGTGGYERKMAVDEVKHNPTGSTKSDLPVTAVNAWRKRSKMELVHRDCSPLSDLSNGPITIWNDVVDAAAARMSRPPGILIIPDSNCELNLFSTFKCSVRSRLECSVDCREGGGRWSGGTMRSRRSRIFLVGPIAFASDSF